MGIVILNWNDYPATSRCLHSLEALAYPRATIYVTDNGSHDGSIEHLEREFAGHGVVFIRNGANLGFAAGCNPGIRLALEHGCEYVLLFNNDCILADPEFLRYAVALAESDLSVGIVGGKILNWPETDRIWNVGGRYSWGRLDLIGRGERDHGQYDSIAARAFVPGALMLIRRALLEDMGLLPDAYFFAYEDWEFTLRARRRGYRILYHPRVKVYHEGGRSYKVVVAEFLYNIALGRVLFWRRNRPRPIFLAWYVAYLAYLVLIFPVRQRLFPGQRVRGVDLGVIQAALLAAARDGLRAERVTAEMLDAFRTRYPAGS